jgi:hypothetical protein
MFKSRYTLSELARLLHRSEDSIVREIEAGTLPLTSTPPARRRGGETVPDAIMTSDIERWLGKDSARRLLDPAAKRAAKKGEEEELTIDQETIAGIRKIRVVGTVKKCQGCGRLLRITEFTKDATSPDWLSRLCKDCQTKKTRLKRRD